MKSEKVAQVLRELSQAHGAVQYGVLGGNAGDALIDLGFFQLAEDIGFEYEVIDLSTLDSSRPLVLSGGGGLVSEWGEKGSRGIIEGLHRRVPLLVVLPQTVRGNEDLLASLGKNVILFTRERQSYEHALIHAKGGAQVLIDHDMAFNLRASEFLQSAPLKLPRLNGLKDFIRLGLFGIATARGRFYDSIHVRRKDGESAANRRSLRIYNDLSFVSAFRGRDKSTVENTGRLLLSLIDRYSYVSTDRLHVGIGAFLLGKTVDLVDNSNSKIKGIYQYSLGSSPRVNFIQSAGE